MSTTRDRASAYMWFAGYVGGVGSVLADSWHGVVLACVTLITAVAWRGR